ncbi:hypothetical protein B0H63DRAFT_559988 [Podospora didyma]|uniref:Uncharacterized protein n=1 Tax=Podospora didyma TaxID=330526 RepID=A0AAE0NPR0_9PEZI|nr:hypothetical protein B0H63DRAFT_559988 [Podospora didyma]
MVTVLSPSQNGKPWSFAIKSTDIILFRVREELSKSASAKPRKDLEPYKSERYGRMLFGFGILAARGIPRVDFTLTLPEDPYNVRVRQPIQRFYGAPKWTEDNNHSLKEVVPQPELQRCDITNRRGDKCGSIVEAVATENLVKGTGPKRQQFEHDEQVATGQGQLNTTTTTATESEFLAISETKTFTKDEFPDWIYYIPTERVESEWDLFFVLPVEHFPVEGFYRRVALGKVFRAAFAVSEED